MFWTIVGIICLIIASVVGVMGIKLLLACIVLVTAFTVLGAITNSDFFLLLVQVLLVTVVVGIAVVLIMAIFKSGD